jgi:hypothetical protein
VNKREQFKQWISALITKNNVELTTAKLEAIKTNNLSVQKLCEEQIDVLAKMQGEIKEGKITSLKELEKKYGTELTDKVKMGKRASFSKRAVAAIETEADKILGKAKEIEASEAELKRLQKAAEQKLKDLDTKVKANPQQKAAYQKEAKEIIKQYNRTVVDTERTIGRELSKMSASELTQLQGKSPFVDKMLKANGKVDNFVKKSRAGKLMLGFGLMSLVGK